MSNLKIVQPQSLPHIIVAHAEGTAFDGKAVAATFTSASDAIAEATRLQISEKAASIRYAVFAYVGTSEPEPGAKFVRVKS